MAIKAVCFDLWWTLAHYRRGSFVIKRFVNYLGSKDKKLGKAFEESTMLDDSQLLEDRFANFTSVYRIKNPRAARIMVKLWKRFLKNSLPYKDSVEVLKELKLRGIKTALITNTIEVRDLLDEFGFTPYLDEIIISAEVGMIKPDPNIYKLAMKRLGSTPSETVMVGDDLKRDIITAKAMGLTTVLITRNRQIKKPREPDYIVKNMHQLVSILERIG